MGDVKTGARERSSEGWEREGNGGEDAEGRESRRRRVARTISV